MNTPLRLIAASALLALGSLTAHANYADDWMAGKVTTGAPTVT